MVGGGQGGCACTPASFGSRPTFALLSIRYKAKVATLFGPCRQSPRAVEPREFCALHSRWRISQPLLVSPPPLHANRYGVHPILATRASIHACRERQILPPKGSSISTATFWTARRLHNPSTAPMPTSISIKPRYGSTATNMAMSLDSELVQALR